MHINLFALNSAICVNIHILKEKNTYIYKVLYIKILCIKTKHFIQTFLIIQMNTYIQTYYDTNLFLVYFHLQFL